MKLYTCSTTRQWPIPPGAAKYVTFAPQRMLMERSREPREKWREHNGVFFDPDSDYARGMTETACMLAHEESGVLFIDIEQPFTDDYSVLQAWHNHLDEMSNTVHGRCNVVTYCPYAAAHDGARDRFRGQVEAFWNVAQPACEAVVFGGYMRPGMSASEWSLMTEIMHNVAEEISPVWFCLGLQRAGTTDAVTVDEAKTMAAKFKSLNVPVLLFGWGGFVPPVEVLQAALKELT